jgi:hypothetical protein
MNQIKKKLGFAKAALLPIALIAGSMWLVVMTVCNLLEIKRERERERRNHEKTC